ncbi:MAG: hypothetical protein P8020_19370 [Acidobacteriota bacterium]
MLREALVWTILFLTALLESLSAAPSAPQAAADLPRLDRPLILTEAKILVTLTDVAQQTMAHGWPIEWHATKSPDWFFFSAYNVGRTNPGGSVTLGHFAVNRHTATVWEAVSGTLVSSPAMGVVQRILREDRGITPDDIEKWSSRRPSDVIGSGASAGSFRTSYR